MPTGHPGQAYPAHTHTHAALAPGGLYRLQEKPGSRGSNGATRPSLTADLLRSRKRPAYFTTCKDLFPLAGLGFPCIKGLGHFCRDVLTLNGH